jgi:hypothetical protein
MCSQHYQTARCVPKAVVPSLQSTSLQQHMSAAQTHVMGLPAPLKVMAGKPWMVSGQLKVQRAMISVTFTAKG